jgi:hypothetical protein
VCAWSFQQDNGAFSQILCVAQKMALLTRWTIRGTLKPPTRPDASLTIGQIKIKTRLSEQQKSKTTTNQTNHNHWSSSNASMRSGRSKWSWKVQWSNENTDWREGWSKVTSARDVIEMLRLQLRAGRSDASRINSEFSIQMFEGI